MKKKKRKRQIYFEGALRLHHGAERRWPDDRRRSAGLPGAKPGGLFVSLALYALTIKSLIAEWDGRARTGGVSQRDDRGLCDRSAAD